ncbi:MAG: MBL fold metallo-hydrolase [Bryobacteraceae bacterium]
MKNTELIVRGFVNEIAPGVRYLPVLVANVYFAGEPGTPWVLVDAGLRGAASRIRHAAERIYGSGARPECIVVTHGHFDHVGALRDLLEIWNVPVYAHVLESPYLNGKSRYPPPDPTVGGFLAQLSRTFPSGGIDVGDRLNLLPEDGSIPGMAGWRAIHTPGHTPGHIALFREADRVLIAGDAVTTVNQEAPLKMIAQIREFRWPPACFTTDWGKAIESVHKLAELKPQVVAAGHGLPASGPGVAEEFDRFAENLRPPRHGRYVHVPAAADESGVTFVPPAPPDRIPKIAAGLGLAALAGIVIAARRRK